MNNNNNNNNNYYKNKKNSNFVLGTINNVNNRSPINININKKLDYSEKDLNLKKFIVNHHNEINKANKKYKLMEEKQIIKKSLILYACHTNNKIKFNSFDSNIKYLKMIPNSELVVINSTNLKSSMFLKNKYQHVCNKYFLIENDKLLDFGKWLYALNNIKLESYDFIVFINDSIIIEKPINFFFSLFSTKNIDYYGYNNSTQTTYHSQSYLFSIKTNEVYIFIEFIEKNNNNITSDKESVVFNLELKLQNQYSNSKNFLNLRKFPEHLGKNIFFNNDYLYFTLKNAGLFPFSKVKRLI